MEEVIYIPTASMLEVVKYYPETKTYTLMMPEIEVPHYKISEDIKKVGPGSTVHYMKLITEEKALVTAVHEETLKIKIIKENVPERRIRRLT